MVGGIITLISKSVVPVAVGIVIAKIGGVLEELVDER